MNWENQMQRISKDPQINRLVYSLLRKNWRIEYRKKHPILIAPNNRKIAVPSTPSDCKAFYSFARQVKYLEIS